MFPAGPTIRPATADDLPAILTFLAVHGPRRQFFPCYEPGDFFTARGAFRDLPPADLLLAFRGEHLVGTLGAWDQRGFRQNVVHAYRGLIGWTRPLYNAATGLIGLPRLPGAGQPFHHLTAALPVAADDDPAVFRALLDALTRRPASGDADYLLVGLHATDPLLPVAENRAATCYTTRLYLVCWEDGESLRASLDGRVPYLELGSL